MQSNQGFTRSCRSTGASRGALIRSLCNYFCCVGSVFLFWAASGGVTIAMAQEGAQGENCVDSCDFCEVPHPTAGPVTWLWRPIAGAWHWFVCTYQLNCRWPYPMVKMDRAVVPEAFRQITNEGWLRQNILSDPHFVDGRDQLSEAGKEKIIGIVTRQPTSRKIIFVYSPDQSLAQRRVAAVQSFLQSWAPGGMVPTVVVTDSPPVWASGKELDYVHKKFLETAPTPRLPAYQPLQVSSP